MVLVLCRLLCDVKVGVVSGVLGVPAEFGCVSSSCVGEVICSFVSFVFVVALEPFPVDVVVLFDLSEELLCGTGELHVCFRCP